MSEKDATTEAQSAIEAVTLKGDKPLPCSLHEVPVMKAEHDLRQAAQAVLEGCWATDDPSQCRVPSLLLRKLATALKAGDVEKLHSTALGMPEGQADA